MITIKSPKTKEDFKAYYDLRYQVLRAPWGQPKGTEKDDYEPVSEHYMAVDSETGEIVGVVKLFEKSSGVGQFSHMAVAKDKQRSGIGHILINCVEEAAKKDGYKVLGCLSRLTCTDFFEKCGYQIVGLPAHYFGTIQVVWMEKKLA